MDLEIEMFVKSCGACQESRSSPSSAPLHPWQWPTQPWNRLHLDFAGPYMGHMFLVIIDAHSKWLDAHIMSSITSTKTIQVLRAVFATHGLPQKVVTDNGPSFTSQEFQDFMEGNGIKHVTSSPYHPSTNGLAERGVQTLKQGIKRTKGDNIQERLSKFLFDYRITPHSTTGVAPSELLMKRRLRSRFDLLHPEVSKKVESQQDKQKESHDNSRPLRKFAVNDDVYVKNLTTNTPKWIAGTVTKVTGPLSYVIRLEDGRIVRRHVDHVRKRDVFIVGPRVSSATEAAEPEQIPTPDPQDDPADLSSNQDDESQQTDLPANQAETETAQATQPRRSARVRKPPEYFDIRAKKGEMYGRSSDSSTILTLNVLTARLPLRLTHMPLAFSHTHLITIGVTRSHNRVTAVVS